jgi:hypothetical protein
MEIKDRITFIDAFKQEFAEYIDHMDEGSKQEWGEYWYYFTLKEGVVKHQFTEMVDSFVNENQKFFDETFEIWVKEFNESQGTASSVTVNPDYTGYGRSYEDWQEVKANAKHQDLTINYQGTEMRIFAQLREEDEVIVYDCYNDDDDSMLGTVKPTMSNDGPAIIWVGEDMPEDLVKLIGEEIERQDA